jgi:hypothetical protein
MAGANPAKHRRARELRRAPEPDHEDGARRFTRLMNGFSKKAENLSHAVSLHYLHYDFARPHTAPKERYPRTPAMAAGGGGR